MKETGVVRKVDELGRVVLPKELRAVFNIKSGTPLEIFIDGECIVLQKYNDNKSKITIVKEIVDCLSTASGLTALFMNLDKVICAKGREAEIFKDAIVNEGIYKKLETRTPFACSASMFTVKCNKLVYISPLISNGNLIGEIGRAHV